MDVLVSINTITYNHEDFIGKAIESFLMQETDFAFEILIGEDHSTDNTLSIVEALVRQHPGRIRLVTDTYNVGMMENVRRLLRSSQGTYIAICEGDDYWTDKRKLQKQVDFMRAHPACSLCCHAADTIDVSTGTRTCTIRPFKKTQLLPDGYFLFGGGDTVPTASLLFKREHVMELPPYFNESPVGDHPFAMLLGSKGRIGYLDEVMSVRNWMVPHSWNTNILNESTFEKKLRHIDAMTRLLRDFDAETGKRFRKDIMKHLACLEEERLTLQCKRLLDDPDYLEVLRQLPLLDQCKALTRCRFPEAYMALARWKNRMLS